MLDFDFFAALERVGGELLAIFLWRHRRDVIDEVLHGARLQEEI